MQAHNDAVQHLIEWGLLGGLAVALWLGRLLPRLAWGDPVTGALVAGLLTCLIQFPARMPATGVVLLALAAIVGAR